MTPLRIGSLCSGYRGLDMAVETVFDATTAWVSDVDPGANKILAHHWPTVPNLGDLTTVDWSRVDPVDILCAGFPCQDVSSAGKRAGIGKGTRTGIWANVAEAIGVLRPSIVVIENVRGLLSPLPMEEPNDRCVCGWPRGWRGLHHDPSPTRGVLDPGGYRDDHPSPAGPELDAERVRRGGSTDPASHGPVGGSDLLDRDWVGGSEFPTPDKSAPQVEAGPIGSSPEGRGDSSVAGAVRSRTSVDHGGEGALRSPSAARAGAEPKGADLPSLGWDVDPGCPACGRPVGDGSGGPVLRSGLDVVLRDLARLGFDAEWCLVRASEVGAPHQRNRLFLLAVAADAANLGHERGRDARDGWAGSADHGVSAADAPGLGRGEGRSESARKQGGSRAAGGSRAVAADAECLGLQGQRSNAGAHPERSTTASVGCGPAGDGGPAVVDWGRFGPAIRRWEAVTGRRAPWATDDRNRLSPAFVEWLMGLPAGHVTAVPDLTRTQQLKALGNGVVPAQAAAAIRLLHQRATTSSMGEAA